MNKQGLKDIVGNDWFEILNKALTPGIVFEIDGIRSQYIQGKEIYPDPANVWKAFEKCPLDKLKVIWLGQDPYPSPLGQATGLAFDCGIRVSPSMRQIQGAYNDCFPGNFNTNVLEGKLDYLPLQGVLLLNTSLTVEADKPNSHKDYWDRFTMTLLYNLSLYDEEIIVICIGKQAEKYTTACKFNNILSLEHPAYAARQGRKWKHEDFFIQINNKLKTLKREEILW